MPQDDGPEIRIRLCKRCKPLDVPGRHHVIFLDAEEDLCDGHLYALVNQLIEMIEQLRRILKGG